MYPDMRKSGWQYETVAAGQTAQVLGASGAAGDYLERLIISPATTGPGLVTLLDGDTSIVIMVTGGTTTLTPFVVPVGACCTNAAWKITTGNNVTVIAVGQFT